MHCFNLHKQQNALHNISITHSHTTQWSCHARHRPARRVQLAFFVFPKDASEHVQEEVGGRKQPTLGLMEPLHHLNHSLLKKILFWTVRNLWITIHYWIQTYQRHVLYLIWHILYIFTFFVCYFVFINNVWALLERAWKLRIRLPINADFFTVSQMAIKS